MIRLFEKMATVKYVDTIDKEILEELSDAAGDTSKAIKLQLSTNMIASVLNYTLPSIPLNGSVITQINGLGVDCIVDGVNLTITGYSAGEIDSTDELKVFY
jgi:hypothetical protein